MRRKIRYKEKEKQFSFEKISSNTFWKFVLLKSEWKNEVISIFIFKKFCLLSIIWNYSGVLFFVMYEFCSTFAFVIILPNASVSFLLLLLQVEENTFSMNNNKFIRFIFKFNNVILLITVSIYCLKEVIFLTIIVKTTILLVKLEEGLH